MMRTYRLQKLDPETVTDKDIKAINTFSNLLQKELLPDDPPRSLAYSKAKVKTFSFYDDYDLQQWYVYKGDEIVASLYIEVAFHEDNQHLLEASIDVLPAYRQQGLARLLLERVVLTAKKHKRRLLIFESFDRVKAGEEFAKRLGAEKGLEQHINQLDMANIDQAQLEAWSANKHLDFSIGFWEGPIPEEELEPVARMMQALNHAPMGSLEVEDVVFTPKQIRQEEAALAVLETQRWMYTMRHESGELAGYTETFWNPQRPYLLSQRGTAVVPKYRGNRLGRCLKAAMLKKALKERPQLKYVRTSNADANEAMLAINRDLGFKPYLAETAWQIDIAKLEAYLA